VGKTDRALQSLREEIWARRLVGAVDQAGGPRRAPPGLLFEVRFGYEALLACPEAAIQYEVDAGVGGTTIDFLIPHGNTRWLMELVGLEESRTITSMRESTRRTLPSGIVTDSIYLSSDSHEPHETPFAELVRVGEKLEEKVWDRVTGQARKFPPPGVGWGHVLVVNMSGFEGTGDPDGAHCRELVFGSKTVEPEYRSDNDKMIVGLFDPSNTRPGAQRLQEVIDVIAFVVERADVDDDEEIRRTIYLLGNPRTNGQVLARAFPIVLPHDRRDPLNRSENGA
jgi:hypothetical protein